MDLDDEEILRTYSDDLAEVLPGFAGTVVEAEVQRWPTGSPYCFPGRAKLQPTLTRRRNGRVFLAGDYLGTSYTDSAIRTGLAAAQEVRGLLALHHQRTPRPLPALPTVA
jgi:oxygen-dependent protoporphyrinogen oxidase